MSRDADLAELDRRTRQLANITKNLIEIVDALIAGIKSGEPTRPEDLEAVSAVLPTARRDAAELPAVTGAAIKRLRK